MTNTIERPLPYNATAERAVLGAILLENESLVVATEHLKDGSEFFLDGHRRIFRAMLALADFYQPVDLVTLSEHLERHNELEAAGGSAYLSQLMDGLPRGTNIQHYARIIKEKAQLRTLIRLMEAIQNRALNGEDEPQQILESARAEINHIADSNGHKGGPRLLKDVVHDSYSQIEMLLENDRRITGLATGYGYLDQKTAGLQSGDLIVLAARPSIGKTSLVLNILENVAVRQKQPCLMFSLEMNSNALLMRLLASVGHVEGHKLRTGHLAHEDFARIGQTLATLSEAPLYVDDSASASVPEMAARAMKLRKEVGIALVAVDYIQLVTTPGRSFRSRQEQVSEISRGLKALAKELNVPLIALSQLTRAPEREDRRPLLSDLRESGAIEQDADMVLFIHKPNYAKKDATQEERCQTEIVIAKQRNGPTGSVDFVFLDRYTRFEQAAPESFGWGEPANE